MTSVACKQLLPVYDKPLIYYPLATLMMSGVREILIISTPADTPAIRNLFGDGSHLGLKIEYEVQSKPEGIAQALVIGEKFIGSSSTALILGDNIFYGSYDFLQEVRRFDGGATIFSYYVSEPSRYGVIEVDGAGRPVSIEEKPKEPKSNYVVTGLYLYDQDAVAVAKELKQSSRREYEITDVNRVYMERGMLKVVRLGRGIAWLDTGTQESLLEASTFIAAIEKRQGQKIACIEEVALRMNLISGVQLKGLVEQMVDSSYRRYLLGVLKEADVES
jgi:glucose-1-phosphate thymidylyltransferase